MKAKKKIVFIFGALGGGGAQRQFGYLINNLDQDKFSPFIISVGKSKKETEEFYHNYSDEDLENSPELRKINFENYYLYSQLKKKEQIYFISKKENSLLKIQFKLAKILKSIKPEITFSISPYSNAISIFPALFCGVKNRIQGVRSNEMLLEYKKSFMNFGYLGLQFITTNYVVNSFDLKDKMKKNGFSPKKIKNIHNGVPVYYNELNIRDKNSKVYIAYIARLHTVKNHKMFFDALSLINSNRIEVHIFGTGYLEKDLKRYVQDKNLQNLVTFEGWKKNISEYLPKIDIVVLTSSGEGFNNSISEAQMHGISVVTTDCTGSSEIVEHGKTGYVVPIGDTLDFSKKLQDLIDNDTLRAQFCESAYKRSRSNFTIEKMVNNYESFFTQLTK